MERKNEKGTPVPFSIQFTTANRSKGTGGEIIEVKRAILSKNRKGIPRFAKNDSVPQSKRSPNHFANATRNIWSLDAERFFKVHIRLINKINNEEVTW